MSTFEDAVESFKQKHGVDKFIAFSGGYIDGTADAAVRSELSDFMENLNLKGVGIITGGTKWNLPQLATLVAGAYGTPVLGIAPERAKDKIAIGLESYILVPSRYGASQFGDETELFVKASSAIVCLGGGAGTLVELAHTMKMNQGKISKQQPPTYIVPIEGFGGITDDYISRLSSEARASQGIFTPQSSGFEASLVVADLLSK